MNHESNWKNIHTWLKVLILVLILATISGIYIYKKSEDSTITNTNEVTEHTNESSENTSDISETEEESLPLAISSVDLDTITSHGLPFVIDFGSDSCIPCQAMAPVLETLHEEWKGKAIVHFVDVWEHTTAADDFPVTVIPTQVFYYADGTPFVPSEEIAKEVEFTIYRKKDNNEHVFTVHQGGITEDQMRKIFAEMGVE